MKIVQSRKKLLFSLAAVLLLLSAGLIWFFFFRYQPLFKESSSINIRELQIEQLENGRVVTITSSKDRSNFEVGQSNLYSYEWRLDDSLEKWRDYRQNEGEYYYLHVYDLTGKKEEKKLDIFALARKVNPDGGVRVLKGIIYYQGTEYLHIILMKKDTRIKLKEMLINIETEELIDYSDDISESVEKRKAEFSGAMSDTKLSETMTESYNVEAWSYGLFAFLNKDISIPSGLNISQTYPELVKEINSFQTGVRVRPGENSEEEWFNILMRWFAPAGEEKLSLSVTDEETGEVTPINSYQDYLTWRETHPEKEKTLP